jgi:hypothetical protein
MLTFITDQSMGYEGNLLATLSHLQLEVKALDGAVLFTADPDPVWTHDLLVEATQESAREALCKNGAVAFLGSECIGSTEI